MTTMTKGSILKRKSDGKMFVASIVGHWTDVHSQDKTESDSVKWAWGDDYVGHLGEMFTLVHSVFMGSEFMRNRNLKIFKVVDRSVGLSNLYIVVSDDLKEMITLQWNKDAFRDHMDDQFTLMDVNK